MSCHLLKNSIVVIETQIEIFLDHNENILGMCITYEWEIVPLQVCHHHSLDGLECVLEISYHVDPTLVDVLYSVKRNLLTLSIAQTVTVSN